MINQAAKRILKALSFDGVEVDAFRHMADLKRLDPMKIFYKKIDEKIYNGSHAVPVRIFFPNEKSFQESNDKTSDSRDKKLLLFVHGGGWVTESIDNYERICARLADATGQYVAAVEYRLAPEDKFPSGLEDCYVVAKALYTGKFVLNVKPENITLIGDSAGGNLCAALSLMARDRGEFMPKRQILIYPATYNDYTEKSPFPSVKENGTDYLLTAGKMHASGILSEAGEKILTKEDAETFIEAGADVLLLPAPGTVPGFTMEHAAELIKTAHEKGVLAMTTIGTSQEGADEETIRQIALMCKMAGADIHHIGDSGYMGMALPENITAYSVAIRGKRHTYRRMAMSLVR